MAGSYFRFKIKQRFESPEFPEESYFNPFLAKRLIIGFLVFSGDMKWEHWPEMG